MSLDTHLLEITTEDPMNAVLLRTAVVPMFAVVLTARSAAAITLPDSGSCNGASPCLTIHSNRINPGSIGLEGSSDNGIGVSGDGATHGVFGITPNGVGVSGQSSTFVGVSGISSTNNGIRGTTTSGSAAAISAISPDHNGLAYWGTGGIIISGSVAQKLGGGAWTSFSDARIKKDVKSLEWGLEELQQVRPVTFKYNGLAGTDNGERVYVGVIAQDLERVLPSMVTSRKAKLMAGDAQEADLRVVDPSAFTYILISAVQEQQRMIERQEARIVALERARGPVGASVLGGGLGTGIALGLLSLGFVVISRRKKSSS
jgi:hypothetical protein